MKTEQQQQTGYSELPLVSIVVVVYNSAKYVVETLESAKAQNYQKIELIISDDASTDNTVDVCKKWLAENHGCFVASHIITCSTNTGVAPNLNRGIKAASGEWIKPIAGDDLLMLNSISHYVEFVQSHRFNVVAAMRYTFYNDDISNIGEPDNYDFFNRKGITAAKQYQIALRGHGAPHNTWFIRKSFIESIGMYDEEFRMMEDWPMKLKVLKYGEKIHFLDKFTVYYRASITSFSRGNNGKIYNEWFVQWYLSVKQKLMMPYLPWDEKLVMKYDILISKFFYNSFLNKFNYFNRALNSALRYPITRCNRYFYTRLKRLSDKLE